MAQPPPGHQPFGKRFCPQAPRGPTPALRGRPHRAPPRLLSDATQSSKNGPCALSFKPSAATRLAEGKSLNLMLPRCRIPCMQQDLSACTSCGANWALTAWFQTPQTQLEEIGLQWSCDMGRMQGAPARSKTRSRTHLNMHRRAHCKEAGSHIETVLCEKHTRGVCKAWRKRAEIGARPPPPPPQRARRNALLSPISKRIDM